MTAEHDERSPEPDGPRGAAGVAEHVGEHAPRAAVGGGRDETGSGQEQARVGHEARHPRTEEGNGDDEQDERAGPSQSRRQDEHQQRRDD